MCLGAEARAANKAAKKDYERQVRKRERDWYGQLSVYGAKRVQYDIGVQEGGLAADTAYQALEDQRDAAIAKAMQEDEKGWIDFLQQSSKTGALARAAAGATGRSQIRMEAMDLGNFFRSNSRRAYALTQNEFAYKRQAKAIRLKHKEDTRAKYANIMLSPTPGAVPSEPVFQNEGKAMLNDGLKIVTTAATVAAPFIIAAGSSKELKDNIIKIGQSIAGHNIYKFNYKGDDRKYVGVIAEEIEQTKPEAVVTMPNGFLGVIYDLIDVTFHEVPA